VWMEGRVEGVLPRSVTPHPSCVVVSRGQGERLPPEVELDPPPKTTCTHQSGAPTWLISPPVSPPPPTPALKPPFPPTPCRLSLPPFFSPPHPRNIIQRLSGQRASRRSPWKTLWVRLPPGVAPRSPMRSRQSYCSASESSSKNKEKGTHPRKLTAHTSWHTPEIPNPISCSQEAGGLRRK
jgi:hypothetical protein